MKSIQMANGRRAGVVMAAGISAVVLLGSFERALATWSIIIVDTHTREVAIGSATCLQDFDLQAGLPVVLVDIGAAAAQSRIDSGAINRMLIREEMLKGTPPDQIINLLAAQDSLHQGRQYGIVDVQGRATTFTGSLASDFANGVTGQTGTLVYAIQGNILTGAPVIEMAEQAVLTTSGDVPAKLMAGMLAARAMGGDGRCSCERESPGSSPTDCGSPPAAFDKAADIGFMVVARTGDTDGVCTGPDGCANGDYFMSFNISFQTENDPDPVLQLQTKFDTKRANLIGRVDAVQSTSSVIPSSFPDDGTGTATLSFTLRDWQGTLVVDNSLLVTVEHAADSAGATTIGPVINDGGGSYHVDLTGSTRGGRDHFLVTAHDPIRPVVLIPRPSLLSICTSNSSCDDGQFCSGVETCEFATGECNAGVAPCTGETPVCNEADDVCEPITCQIASAPLPDMIADDAGITVLNEKNRYLSFEAGDPGQSQAIRVTFVSLPAPFDIWNGAQLWVQEPCDITEVSASTDDTPPTFKAAQLSCQKFFRDWSSLGVIDVYHEGIIPGGSYKIEVIDATCDQADPASFSPAVTLHTSGFGDLAGGAYNQGGQFWPAADGTVDVTPDVVALLNTFSNLPQRLRKARADIEPACLDHKINIGLDVLYALLGFGTQPYPLTPSVLDACLSSCTAPLHCP